jgi:trehalose 6-phosphate phosphatase
MHGMSLDPLPPFARAALMLDLDGTLVDFAAEPEAVVVEPGLADTIRALRDRLGGALAVVTGRPVETVDRLLGDAPYAVAGEHGGAIRASKGAPLERVKLPSPPPDWLERAEKLVAAHPGSILERKARGFALHFRMVPTVGPLFRDELAAILDGSDAFDLAPAHMLWEVRPRGADKGGAVTALMRSAPFANRLPVFIGDDVTDEDGMRVARAVGGAGLRVDAAFRDPAGVRAWLHATLARDDWAPLPI